MPTPPSLDDRQNACKRPEAPVVMYQEWKDLLFLHWEMEAEQIEEGLPEGLWVDQHEGKCFVGIVPFFMRGIRPRFCPAVPGISNFLELNVRTYVHDQEGRPGVWFYSLDANQTLAVKLARRFFHLPYFRADMGARLDSELIEYSCRRRGEPDVPSVFRYTGKEPTAQPEPGSLDFFLLERYLLFAFDERREQLYCGQVHHSPYPVQEVEVDAFSTVAMTQAGFDVGENDPIHAAFSPGVSVEIFGIQKVNSGR